MEMFWEGRILLIYTAAGSLSSGVALQRARFEEVKSRLFLVGEVPKNAKDWAAGLPVAIAWDQVAHYLVFSDVEEYCARVEHAPSFLDLQRSGSES